jgi:hypothetical protein
MRDGATSMRFAFRITLMIVVTLSGCATTPLYKGHVHVSVNPATGFR